MKFKLFIILSFVFLSGCKSSANNDNKRDDNQFFLDIAIEEITYIFKEDYYEDLKSLIDENTEEKDPLFEEEDFKEEEILEIEEEEIECSPDCEGKVCGPDGCGSICGYCPYGYVCSKDFKKCEEICIPKCKNKMCGSDGCSGECGKCDEGFICDEKIFICVKEECKPKCENKECGDNGCEGLCGICAQGYICSSEGLCVKGPCAGITEKGKCNGDIVMYCQNNILIKINCGEDPLKTCGWDPWLGKYACIEKPPCVPQCEGKECGDDGCKGSCGTCPLGWACPLGICKPVDGATCGYIPENGYCWKDNTLYWCSGGIIFSENCTKEGKFCTWVPKQNQFACK